MPDALVNCGESVAREAMVAPNPIIVVEVLSPTTRSLDKTIKLADFKGVTLKKKAPVSNEVLKVKFPKPVESKLKNGVELAIVKLGATLKIGPG